ncbi:hypothetical protein BFW01_g9606 [Lasiodiplodia theobromae]|uniref:Uncharacterized protein n=1 Tax=Lasiodiplodia theobromae TaxID=45133 RepID=A0A5N5DM79_9PEZI|nr:hypothetical protein DBV05_g2545 [Lasiodiplodia theobromae]KAF9638709.1 hypothetical protein BFW01_g9606 [Lasiodiplodia theobromae]
MVSDCSSRSRAVKSNRDAARLSQENLRALEASHYESDTHYAENVVSAEGQMMAYQEMWRNQEQARKRDSGLAFSADDTVQNHESGTEEFKIPKRPRVSVETPFRRYVTIGPGEDPFPLYGKQAMEDMPVKYGSLEDVEARRDAAMLLEQSVKRQRGDRHTI